MEIADSISCDFYRSHNWEGREESRFHIYKNNANVGLDIETAYMGDNRKTEEITSLEISQMDLETVQLIQTRLGDWLQNDDPEPAELTTSPVEGIYEDSSGKQEVHNLQIEITFDGFRILALSSGRKPVANAVRIPPTDRVHDDQVGNCHHLNRLYSLIEIFLAGIQKENRDVLQGTQYLLNPDTHLHTAVPVECINRLEDDDYTGVIQAAGTALEEILENHTPDDIVANTGSASDLANRAFRANDPAFEWGHTDGEQKGLMFLYSGAFKALRNPVSHPRGDPDRNRFLDDIDERDALDALCLFNFLIRRLEVYSTTTLEREEN